MDYLGMTLQWTPRLPVDIDNLAIWVTREVDSNMNDDLRHFLVDLGLVSAELSQPPVRNRTQSLVTFFSDFSFLMYGLSFPDMDVTSLKKPNSRS
jgi:hypothetical protein